MFHNHLEFEEKPINSASIAQVHVAYLKDGTKVAVKVQHDWLKEECPLDLKLTEFSLEAGKKLFDNFNYDFLVTDVKKTIPQELDFRIEAENAIEIKRLFENDKLIKVPTIYKEFSSVRDYYVSGQSTRYGIRQRDQHRQQVGDGKGRHQHQRGQQHFGELFFEANFRVWSRFGLTEVSPCRPSLWECFRQESERRADRKGHDPNHPA